MTACSAHRSNHTEETIRGQEVAAEGYRKQSFCTDLSHSRPRFHPLVLCYSPPPSISDGEYSECDSGPDKQASAAFIEIKRSACAHRRRARPCFLCLSPISPAAGEPADSFVPGSRGFKPWRSGCAGNPGSCVTRIKTRPKPSFRLPETRVTTAMTWSKRVPQLQQI